MLALLVVEGKQKMAPADCKEAEGESYESTCQKMEEKKKRKTCLKTTTTKKDGTLPLQQGRESEHEQGGGAHQPRLWTAPQPAFPFRTEPFTESLSASQRAASVETLRQMRKLK